MLFYKRQCKGQAHIAFLEIGYKNPENTVVCKNVSRIDVDGEYVLIRDILGEEIRLQGKIKMVDLANSIVELDCE